MQYIGPGIETEGGAPMDVKMKKIVGLILGLSLVPLLTTFHTCPFIPAIAEIMIFFGIVAVSAAVAGFVSLDWRIGLIAGIVGGLVGWPLSFCYFLSLALSVRFDILLTAVYRAGLGMFILNALVGGATGVIVPRSAVLV